jgi:menaquinone-dependent protoporphyrinogen IX oxidase
LAEKEKEIKLSEYKEFVLAAEIEDFMKLFQTDVNVFIFHNNENCYSKQHSYIYLNKAIFSLNISLLNLPKYQHTVWLGMLIVHVIALLVRNVK